jgi:hypothetical protein
VIRTAPCTVDIREKGEMAFSDKEIRAVQQKRTAVLAASAKETRTEPLPAEAHAAGISDTLGWVFIGWVLIVALSISYYHVIFLPKQERVRRELKALELSIAEHRHDDEEIEAEEEVKLGILDRIFADVTLVILATVTILAVGHGLFHEPLARAGGDVRLTMYAILWLVFCVIGTVQMGFNLRHIVIFGVGWFVGLWRGKELGELKGYQLGCKAVRMAPAVDEAEEESEETQNAYSRWIGQTNREPR